MTSQIWAVGAGIVLTIGCLVGVAGERMATRNLNVERFSVVSSRPFDEVLARMEGEVGHPDMAALLRKISAAETESELEDAVNQALGPTGLIEFNRFNLGEVLRKEQGAQAPQIVRLLVGNPLIMKQMVRFVPDAGSYAPVTILIDQRADGVHVSYDTMSSFLAVYGSERASLVARDLDAKIETLIKSAAF
jgi:uncharacterized protein (DUF302 family)